MFDSTTLSFRVYTSRERLTPDILKGIASDVAPPLETLNTEPIEGWVGPGHLLDRDMSARNCIRGNRLLCQYMVAERKVPRQLLNAHCRLAEIEEKRVRGLSFLSRSERQAIRRAIEEQMKPEMPPTLTGIEVVVDFETQRVYATAMTDKAIDKFVTRFKKATDCTLEMVTPEKLALDLRQLNAKDLDSPSFVPDGAPGESVLAVGIGLDFNTWLMFMQETQDTIDCGDRSYATMFEGPFTFIVRESPDSEGAETAVVREGAPQTAAEAKTAMLCGKKLDTAVWTLAWNSEQWRLRLDGQEFGIHKLRIPKTDETDPDAAFDDHMQQINFFVRAFLDIYAKFLDLRASRNWERTCEAMRLWIRDREAKA